MTIEVTLGFIGFIGDGLGVIGNDAEAQQHPKGGWD